MFSLSRTAAAAAFARPAAVAASSRLFSSTARAQLAKITIVGNLAGPPLVEATSTGNEIIKYSVASNSGPKDNRQTSWFNVAVFGADEGPRRDFLTGLEKGTLVYIEGDAKINTYQDRETGKNRQALQITQRTIEVLKRPSNVE